MRPARNAAGPSPRSVAIALLGAAALGPTATAAAASAPSLTPSLVLWRYADGSAFQQPRGLAFDPVDGALYVSNAGRHRIEVFTKTGRAVSQFVHRVPGSDGRMVDGTPGALAFDRSGKLLVADLRSHAVDVLDRRGRLLQRLPAMAGQPNTLAVGADGTIYVGTTGEETRVHRFAADYRPLATWGEEGTEPGRLSGLNALWVLNDGSVAVACHRTDLAVQIFSATGDYLRGFGSHEVGEGSFSFPSGLVATPGGRIWVLDEIRQSLQVFDELGTLIREQGRSFAHPSSMTYDGTGRIALTEGEIGRVQVFDVSDE